MSGNYYKYKTKKYLEDKGYDVDFLERYIRWLDKKTNSVKMFKKDIFSSDIIAMNENELIFIQVKQGKKNIAEAIKKFNTYHFPKFVGLYIYVWDKGYKEPEILDVREILDK